MQTETFEEFCPNCNLETYPFISSSSFYKGTYSYCKNVNCFFASYYDDTYQMARKYYINHKANVYGFDFFDPNEQTKVKTDSNEKTIKYYKLDLSNIVGFEDVKDLLRKSVNTPNPVHILLNSPPSVSKTYLITSMFNELEEQGAKCLFIDGSSASPSGIAELLQNTEDVQFCAIDELDSFGSRKIDQKFLLLMLQNGFLRTTKSKKIIKIDLSKTKFYFSSNEVNRLIDPLLSRLVIINLPNYSETEFYNVGLKVLENKYNINNDMGYYLVDQIYTLFKPNSYIRDVEKVAKLLGNNISYPNIDKVIRTMEKYRV